MITAKNYAAQAESTVKNISKSLGEKMGLSSDERKKIGHLSNLIGRAAHFALPDNGFIFNDGCKGLNGLLVKLPFDIITIEFFDDTGKTDNQNKHLILCSHDATGKIIIITYFRGDKYGFLPSPISCVFSDDVVFNSETFKAETFCNLPELLKLQKINGVMADAFLLAAEKSILVMCELLEALSCTNVESSIHQPASPKNAQRIKSHKLPIYETKVLTIKASKSQSSSTGINGTHASPRQHLRRGHIRRLETGNIWVNSCVVGSKENGVIDKQYKVTA